MTQRRVAIPVWRGRVSPVFEAARNLVLLEVEDGIEKNRRMLEVDETHLPGKLSCLAMNRIDVLVCGAISQPLFTMCDAAKITVIPWVAGEVERVVEAFLNDDLPSPTLTMPGCVGPRKRFRHQRRRRGK